MYVATPGYVGLHDRIDDLTHQYFPRMNLGQTRLGVLHKQSFTFVPGPAKPTKEGEPGASAYEKPMKPEKEERIQAQRDPQRQRKLCMKRRRERRKEVDIINGRE